MNLLNPYRMFSFEYHTTEEKLDGSFGASHISKIQNGGREVPVLSPRQQLLLFWNIVDPIFGTRLHLWAPNHKVIIQSLKRSIRHTSTDDGRLMINVGPVNIGSMEPLNVDFAFDI